MYAVIMAGGQGTRLWPKSRAKTPKQLHALVGEKTLIQQTYANILPAVEIKNFFVSTTPQYLSEIKKQLPSIPEENFIVEPYPMNTAAACGLVSKIINLRDPEATVGFFPSDHNINQPAKFAKLLRYAAKISAKHPKNIFTIGLKPTKPDTALGYIHFAKEIDRSGELATYSVERFVEKPDSATAEKYMTSGEYLWNAGMFIWKTKLILELIEKNLPKTSRALDKIAEAYGKQNYNSVLEKYYREVDDISIDYGIMEKNKNIFVIPGDFGWSDVGSWGTILKVLSEIGGTDVISRGHHMSVGDSNLLVMGHDKMIATVGLDNIIVVDTPDVLLICNGKKDQKIKELINRLKDEGKIEYL